ncbi:MAG TPA: DUF2934 domain-containing protein [Gemmataceae bacterium]|jgi:hypothetical protein|nr:DUF2934 domain-containing protein [Gemmataceae bacterium]
MAKRIFMSAKARATDSVPAAETKVAPAAHAKPKTLAVSEDDIRLAAYYKWEAAGRPAGDGHSFWTEAEMELRKGAAEK